MCRVACRRAGTGELGTRGWRFKFLDQPTAPNVPQRPAGSSIIAARYRDDFRHQVAGQLDELHAMVEKLCQRAASAPAHDLPEALFHAFTDMIEAEIDESIARAWIDRMRDERELRTSWPIRCS